VRGQCGKQVLVEALFIGETLTRSKMTSTPHFWVLPIKGSPVANFLSWLVCWMTSRKH